MVHMMWAIEKRPGVLAPWKGSQDIPFMSSNLELADSSAKVDDGTLDIEYGVDSVTVVEGACVELDGKIAVATPTGSVIYCVLGPNPAYPRS
jgi:hypothetical protein